MAVKLNEHTYGTHIYMKMQLDNKRIEEIDVYIRETETIYKTSADNGLELCKTDEEKQAKLKLREEIINAFNELY